MNYRRGALRVFLLFTTVWAIICGYRVFTLTEEVEINSSISDSLNKIEDVYRRSYIREHLADSKKRAAEYAKLPVPMPPYDESRAGSMAEEKAEEFLSRQEDRGRLQRAQERVSNASESRSQWIKLLVLVPLGIAFLTLGAVWAAAGFRKP